VRSGIETIDIAFAVAEEQAGGVGWAHRLGVDTIAVGEDGCWTALIAGVLTTPGVLPFFFHCLNDRAIVLRVAPSKEVPALSGESDLIQVDARRDQFIAHRGSLREDYTQRGDNTTPADQHHAIFNACFGNAHDE
jgi:hypothetical protein